MTSSNTSHNLASRRADSSASTTSSEYVGEYERNPAKISSKNVLRSRKGRRWSIVRSYVMQSNLNQIRKNLYEDRHRNFFYEDQHPTDESLPTRDKDSVHPNDQGKYSLKVH